MQILDRKHEASKVIASYRFVQSWHFSDDIEHLLSSKVLHQQKDIFFIMEGLNEPNDERKNCFFKNLLLLYYTQLHLLFFHCLLG